MNGFSYIITILTISGILIIIAIIILSTAAVLHGLHAVRSSKSYVLHRLVIVHKLWRRIAYALFGRPAYQDVLPTWTLRYLKQNSGRTFT